MNELEFGKLMIERGEVARRVDELDEKITAYVMGVGETQKFAGVIASYYNESTRIDWAAMAIDHNHKETDEDVLPFATTKTTVKWAKYCESINLNSQGYTVNKPARVVIKVMR